MVPVAFQMITVLQVCSLINSYVVIQTKTETSKNLIDSTEEDAGEPLFLTSYIKSGKIEEGKSASRVGPILPDDDFVSYSGFLTVNDEYNSNLFFWFCLSKQDPENAPVLLWLTGGPGCSSFIGSMEENGPYELKLSGELIRREYAWTNEFNMVYFDQPVGTGFSFTQNEAGYAKSEDDVSRDMYNALAQFFQLFHEYSQNEFYLTGESYAGHYIPAVAYEIHKRNSDANVPMKINMKGCLIGNGYVDPEKMNVMADYMYQLGFTDLKTVKEVRDLEAASNTYIRAGDYAEACEKLNEAWYAPYSFPWSATYNILNTDISTTSPLEELFRSNYIRKRFHVGNLNFLEFNEDVYDYLYLDYIQSVAPLFVELLNHCKILLYSGQLDVIVGYPLTRNLLENLHFSGAVEYYENDLILWYDECGIQAGHYKVAANLTDLLVLTAGHMVPADQPRRALQMVREFINGELS